MKRCLNLLIVFLLTIYMTEALYAGPARPGIVIFVQPDGSKISITLQGNENRHWAITPDGYTALFDKKGYYAYAIHDEEGNLIPSDVVVHDLKDRNTEEIAFISKIPKGLFFSKQQTTEISRLKSKVISKSTTKSFPTKGTNKLACILVSYSDVPFTRTASDFYDLFNKPGYSYDGAQGSVRDYYKEVSYGKLDINTDVYGPYTLSHNRAYYGPTNMMGITPGLMVQEAIDLADGDIDFTQYDNDGNGIVEGVFVVFAGLAADAGGPEESIWSHAKYLQDFITHDGLYFERYSCTGEFRDASNNMTRIGVICHEMGHIFGASDYYDINGLTHGSYPGTGGWDLMGGGGWNNSGNTPAPPNAYVRSQVYNWATPTLLNTAQKGITMKNSEENPVFNYFETPAIGEYFILENKTKTGYDSYIPGEGLLIYHVMIDTFFMPNEGFPQKMYPVCASAGMDPTAIPTSYGDPNDSLCVFTGAPNSRAFAPYTLPSTINRNGNYASGQLTNINYDKSTNLVSFDFSGIKVSTITIRARGTKGDEHINLLLNDSIIGNGWTLTTSYQDYNATVIGYGDIKVQFNNDASGRDVQVDYVLVNGEKRQAENMTINTGFYANGRCGGGSKSEWLNCNGVIDFGKTTDNIGENTIVIRARGIQGGEHINLLINDNAVSGWNLATSIAFTDGAGVASYTYEEFTAKINGDGDIKVQFDNDATGRDVQVDWVKVNNQKPREAVKMQFNTGFYANGKCGGGSYSGWLNCNGYIDFGKISDDYGAIQGNVSECGYTVPLTTALPSLNKQYNYIHVIGSSTTLSFVNKFTIQWSLPNKGLYDISYNTSNGTPNWYVSLMGKVTQTFAFTSPSITISGSGISILDGSYWVTMDGDNFVMVSKSGGYSIYCSNSATPPCSKLKSVEMAIDDEKSSSLVKLYPNPSSGDVAIEFDDTLKVSGIKICELTGKVIYSKTDITESVIRISGLREGVYIVSITYNDREFNKKLIVY